MKFKLPNQNQLKEASKKHFEACSPTYIENWNKELCSLSIGQTNLILDYKDVVQPIVELMYECKPFKEISVLENRLTYEIEKFPKGAFVRLGSRSPKDVDIYPVFNGKQALKLLLNSIRVLDDLCLAINNKYNPNIFIREWKDIPEWSEFRCFMKDRKLIGISQYNYNKYYPEIEKNKDCIYSAIMWFFETFKEKSHLDTVIFDVFLKQTTTKALFDYESSISIWEVKLLEINPYNSGMTDPCLFDWRKTEMFNGQFLYNKVRND